MIILGHRGEGVTNRDAAVYGVRLPQRTNPFYNNDIFPENSLSAFESALKHGADGIECDVFASKDNVPMIIHAS
jgi:glycerophosphoryl diester phosphodiesterase